MNSDHAPRPSETEEAILINREQLSKLVVAAREQGFLLALLFLRRRAF